MFNITNILSNNLFRLLFLGLFFYRYLQFCRLTIDETTIINHLKSWGEWQEEINAPELTINGHIKL